MPSFQWDLFPPSSSVRKTTSFVRKTLNCTWLFQTVKLNVPHSPNSHTEQLFYSTVLCISTQQYIPVFDGVCFGLSLRFLSAKWSTPYWLSLGGSTDVAFQKLVCLVHKTPGLKFIFKELNFIELNFAEFNFATQHILWSRSTFEGLSTQGFHYQVATNVLTVILEEYMKKYVQSVTK